MPHILLTGAGFSRNWGGWLADEAFEYLLGCSQLDDGLRVLLWKHKGKGGFEAALSELQTEAAGPGVWSTPLFKLNEAIRGMFADMNEGFSVIEPSIRKFLSRFDAIFTLNQDLLMERNYLNDNLSMLRHPRGWWP